MQTTSKWMFVLVIFALSLSLFEASAEGVTAIRASVWVIMILQLLFFCWIGFSATLLPNYPLEAILLREVRLKTLKDSRTNLFETGCRSEIALPERLMAVEGDTIRVERFREKFFCGIRYVVNGKYSYDGDVAVWGRLGWFAAKKEFEAAKRPRAV